ncbi:MAG TPA: extracellular solute-binding protein [Dehalococcoidia bacterium]|nr:extracellular solute-binding protein [Dehalococcoidia bacterium]
MRQWLLIPALLAGLLALAACAGEEKQATPAPAASPGGGKAAWEEEWDRVLAAAKREGKVTVMGPAGAEARRALTEPFEKKYGISVEYMAGRGSDQAGRLRAEREAGQYLWDIYVGGSSTPITVLKPVKALEPIEKAFILPEVKELKNWRQGKYPFLDKEGLVFAMIGQRTESLIVNPSLVKPGEIKSLRQLLDPKWKGKITVNDPTVTSSGQGQFHFYYAQPDLGPDFIRELAKQDLHITRDTATQVRWVAEGRYAICIGCSARDAEPLLRAGVPLDLVTPDKVKEGGYIGTSTGALVMFNRAPHPNAAKVYVNWLLSKEGATEFVASTTGFISRRADVPPPQGEEWAIPAATDVPTDTEEARLQREQLVPFFKQVLGQ